MRRVVRLALDEERLEVRQLGRVCDEGGSVAQEAQDSYHVIVGHQLLDALQRDCTLVVASNG